ncbi:vWA domain-containing protein [Nocardia mexicana]|uniref:Ca-activated chloride channel family protein n=1 Tax=Nocardia mexicana TaxID=279262 RepID=A0A370HJR7_9NOCA|nr:VWA domain-containing protein [Nocardia mexicana]RDI55749.1 Ca-activated chloride channel family protein [Nocardia mexicana]
MTKLKRLVAAVAAGLVALTPAALPAAAQADQAPQYAPTMLILDASGSMQRPDPAGTMMDAAKNAVRTFVGSAPAEAKVGLTTYGTSTGNSEAEKSAGCRDVSVLRRPDTIDKAALIGAADGIKASGWTPMGTSLREAAKALPSSGPRSIVLVSDGDDTCSPPEPCDVARELKKQGLDLVVHSIGFAVDAKARAQLSCMAQATGGTYSDAVDGPALERILPRVSGGALRNYQASGTPITGTDRYHTAPAATPGHYLDTIGQKEKRYYAVDVPEGATAYFSGIMSYPRLAGIDVLDDTNLLQMHVYGRDGEDCNKSETEHVTNSSDGATLTISTAFDGATKKPGNSASGNKCKGGGRYYFALDWKSVSTGVPERLPLELLVGIEPAVTDPGPKAVLPATTFTEPSGAGSPVTGGGSLSAASTLPGSGRYTDTLRQGEFVFYRVKLDWGQGLAYRVHFDANDRRGLADISNIHTAVYSPLAKEIDWESGVYVGTDTVLPTSDPAVATTPVRYGNRNADDSHIRDQTTPGWYYISVKLGSAREGVDHLPVPIRLDLTVTGTPEPGPKYTSEVAGGIVGDHGQATGGGPDRAGSKSEAASTNDSSSALPIVIGSAAAVAVLVVGVLIGWLVARRRRG